VFSFPSGLFPLDFPTKILYTFLIEKRIFKLQMTETGSGKETNFAMTSLQKTICYSLQLTAYSLQITARASHAGINVACGLIWAWNLMHKRELFCSHVCCVEKDAGTLLFRSQATSLAQLSQYWTQPALWSCSCRT
jgi:hypothetical protein